MVMKIGIFTAAFSDWPAKKVFDYVSKLGYQMVELASGGAVPATHLPDGSVDSLLKGKASEFKEELKKYDLTVSALSFYENILDADANKRKQNVLGMKKTIEAAHSLDVTCINTSPGCSFDWGRWYSFPFENIEIYEKGWKEAKEGWTPILDFAANHNVRICIEAAPHSWGIAYNPDTTERMLKEIPHKSLGLNYDPSHFIWQMASPILPIKRFGSKIFHFHAKDTKIYPHIMKETGVMITGPWTAPRRSWRFRVPGWGDADWKGIISALMEIGYDNVLSLEFEDSTMSAMDGAKKYIDFIKPLIIEHPLGETWFK